MRSATDKVLVDDFLTADDSFSVLLDFDFDLDEEKKVSSWSASMEGSGSFLSYLS